MTTYEALTAERYGPTPDQIEGRRRLDECVREAEEVLWSGYRIVAAPPEPEVAWVEDRHGIWRAA